MSTQWLHDAGDAADRAAATTDDLDARERLENLSEQLHNLADRDRGPDHGRLARIENILSEIEEQVDDATAAEIDECHEAVIQYRETVEGV